MTNPAGLPLGPVPFSVWRLSGSHLSLDEFIEDQCQYLNSIDLQAFGSFSGRLFEKLSDIQLHSYPGLDEAVQIVVQVIELPDVQETPDPLPQWLAEIVFAASYLLKEADLIPDHIPEIGLADDRLVLQRIIARNETELRKILGPIALNEITNKGRPS
jgi:hypothetical protein